MSKPYIYYKEQCKYCLKNGKCDYFDLDQLAYNKNNPPETCG